MTRLTTTNDQRSQVALVVFASKSLDMAKTPVFPPEQISEIVQMALSDHVSFADITRQYGIAEKQVKALMRANLRPGSYRAWRKRVRDFGDRREHYK